MASERGKSSSNSQELSEAKNRVQTLVSKVSDLESENLKLNQKISDLAQNMEDKNSAHKAQVGKFPIRVLLSQREIWAWFNRLHSNTHSDGFFNDFFVCF